MTASTTPLAYDPCVESDPLWTAVCDLLRELGPVVERSSRYADKPALCLHGREIAHLEAPGVIDLRITRAAWTSVRSRFAGDPAVVHDPRRRDWIELRIGSPSDLDRLRPLLTAAVAANA